ncbi:restriction endonuclease [Kutzneria buriramensis]|uniref:Restriction endonuclease n=2 Tax=Kutzneria buriramensis TaxID=1045776 RepID=A0A3E0HUH0_9PSEU|nr:restriction endonuclease [Kutzneria buriramensis]
MQDLAPNAKIHWNDHILGKDSGIRRQIDVAVRWMDGPDERLLIVDAKNWSKPADVGAVEKFASMVKDVRASSGVLVCNAGFAKTIHDYARKLGVSLWNLHDAESRDWSRDLTIPLVWLDLEPTVKCSVLGWFDAGDGIIPDGEFPFVLSFDDGSSDEFGSTFVKVDPVQTFVRAWNGREVPRSTGQVHRISLDRSVRALVRDRSDVLRWRPLKEFGMSYTVDCKSWLGQFSPDKCRGLIDHLDDQAFVATYLPVGQIPVIRDESWQPVDDPDRVAVSIRGTFVTTESIKFLVNTGAKIHDLNFTLLKREPYGD